MAIKSLAELRKLRATLHKQVSLREKGEISDDSVVEILIGMGTCGIAAGARETFNRMIDEINKKDVKDIKIISVGCVGFCHVEPTIQVNIPGREPVIYGPIKEDSVEEFVDTVLIKRELMDEKFLIKSFQKAVL